MSLGFTLALLTIGVIRELLGAGALFGVSLYNPAVAATIMVLPPGAFITIGFLMALLNKLENKVQ